ncbi:MAG: sulfatase-like hydrolase/transferase [Synechococcus sp.]
MLLQHGYNTYAVGKWHLTPAEQTSAAGPYDRWPLGRGFERFYGFLGGDTHQYYPELVQDNSQVAPDKPFFMYFCTGAMHAPHHVPKEWIERYKGRFDDDGKSIASRPSRDRSSWGSFPTTPCSRRSTPMCPTGRGCLAKNNDSMPA